MEHAASKCVWCWSLYHTIDYVPIEHDRKYCMVQLQLQHNKNLVSREVFFRFLSRSAKNEWQASNRAKCKMTILAVLNQTAMNLKDLSPSTRQIEGPSNRAHRVKQGFYEYKSALLKGIWGSNRRSCTQHSAIHQMVAIVDICSNKRGEDEDTKKEMDSCNASAMTDRIIS